MVVGTLSSTGYMAFGVVFLVLAAVFFRFSPRWGSAYAERLWGPGDRAKWAMRRAAFTGTFALVVGIVFVIIGVTKIG